MKITPQQFLDSTEFDWLGHSLQEKRNYRKSVRVVLSMLEPVLLGRFPEMWRVCSPVRETSRNLTEEEYDSIDWTGFDCSKPLERTK